MANIPIRGRKVTVSPPSRRDTVTIKVTYPSAPNAPTVTTADLKYNKKLSFGFVKDDGGPGDWTDVYPYVLGGVAGDGVTYPGFWYSDGAGRAVKWHWTFALCWNQGQQSNATSTAKHLEMLRSGCIDVSNHSYTHSGFVDRHFDIKMNEIAIYKLLDGYRTRTVTIPTSFEALVEPAFAENYILTASQGYGTGGSSADDNQSSNPVRVLWGERVASNETRRLISVRRWWNDSWQSADVDNFKAWVDSAFSASTGASAATKFFYQGFSHNPTYDAAKPTEWLNWRTCMDYVAKHPSNTDSIWMAGLQEFAEYMEMKQKVIISQSLSGNELTITLKYDNVSQNARWLDLSLLTTGGTISSVTVTGADDYSFNATTGLINIYKKRLSGIPDPALDVLPPKLVYAKTYSSDLTKVYLTFDRAVNFTSAGFQVFKDALAASSRSPTSLGTEITVSSYSGSGKNYVLQLSGAISNITFVDYRIQRGITVDAVTGQKVSSFISVPVVVSSGSEPTAGQRRVTVVLNSLPLNAQAVQAITLNGTTITDNQFYVNSGDTITVVATSTGRVLSPLSYTATITQDTVLTFNPS